MKISDILAKIARKEDLTDEERSELTKLDLNAIAAAARKEAEGKAATIAEQLAAAEKRIKTLENSGKTELEQAQSRIKELEAEHAKATKALEAETTARRQMVRDSKIAQVFGKLKFIDGIDTDLIRGGFAQRLADLKDEDLDKEEATKPFVDAFTKANKGIIADASGHGTGKQGNDGRGTTAPQGKDPSKMSDTERLADLQNKGLARK